MNTSIDLTITNIHARTWLTRLLTRNGLFLILLLCACVGLAPAVRAVTPAPDGGYGGSNTAEGSNALFSLTTGVWNSAFGHRALFTDTTGLRNTAIGYEALYNNNGRDNVAVGTNALFSNTTGIGNIAIGSLALYHNTTGSNNIAIGNRALRDFTGSGNTQIGDSFSSSPDTVLIGRPPTLNGLHCDLTDPGTLSTNLYGHDDVYVGMAFDFCPFPKTLRVHLVAQDAVYVDAVYGNPIAGSAVTINTSGQLGVAPSSQRFKDAIKPMDKASESILALKPVTFRYKREIEPKGIPQFGLVAEEVEKVNPDLVTRDAKGEVYTVRYEAVQAMLLNEFLKAHSKMEEQEATIAQLKSKVAKQETAAAHQQKQIEALTAGLQKVSAQVEMNRPAPQTALNRP